MGNECTYCGSDTTRHEPVFVTEGDDAEPVGEFCNFACLAAHIETENLASGAACEWSPASDA